MKKKITIVTTDKVKYPDLDSENISMANSLIRFGFDVTTMSWHDILEQLRKDKYKQEVLLIRTVWDYPQYLEKFKEFINLLKKSNIVTINPANVIEWNINKQYLFDLQNENISIVPCEYYQAGSTIIGKNVKRVVKPVIGLGASGTQILNEGCSVRVDVDSIVNPFRSSIHDGELSVVMISGRAELYIRKVPSPSDWRVQPQYGGKYLFEQSAPSAAIEVCQRLYRYIKKRFVSDYLLFMRVDLIQNDFNNEWEILEFEVIDPSLYGDISSSAIDALSSSLKKLFCCGS